MNNLREASPRTRGSSRPPERREPAGLIRLANPDDAREIRGIYVPYVLDPAISMETVVPGVATMRQRIAHTLTAYPWLVEVRDGRIAGYAYAGPHRVRHAWRWCCETTVYVGSEFRGKGVGERLYRALFTLLRLQNYLHAFAFIMLPNEASVRLHERCGFVPLALYPQAGYKQGLWFDVGVWRLALGALPDVPTEPIAFPQLADAAVEIALR
jgi:L-amino acid N-acyltransferase YncA